MNDIRKIAVCGKGGVGKTTFASVLVHLIAKEGNEVFAIDADPNSTLAEALGVSSKIADAITPIIEMRELIAERTGSRPGEFGSYFKLNPRVKDIPSNYSVKFRGINILKMGETKGAEKGCACPENTMVKALMSHLIVKEKETVVLDMVAGTEHMGRGTAKAVDVLFVVVEPGTRSIKAAKQFYQMAEQLGIQQIYFVGNKIRNDEDKGYIIKEMNGFKISGFLPQSEKIVSAERSGKAIFDCDPEYNQNVSNILTMVRQG